MAEDVKEDVVKVVDLGLLDKEVLEDVRLLAGLFRVRGHQVRVAGGAVRDLLLGQSPEDVDLATTCDPATMKSIEDPNVRIVSTAGEKHGTITFRIRERTNLEVTTLRIDETTDGRRAPQVRFTDDWRLDAARRDLTVNSMYLDIDDGALHDYFGGAQDLLLRRRVAFVGGDPDARIKEDYLRILRYFRFFGRLANDDDGPDCPHDEATMKAIRDNAAGMAAISGERIWSEWKKILVGRLGSELTKSMIREAGIGPHIGLANSPNLEELSKVKKICDEKGLKPQAPTLLAALLRSEQELLVAHERLKMSAYERDLAAFVIAHRGDADEAYLRLEDPMHMYKCLAIDTAASNAKVKGGDKIKVYISEVMAYRGEAELHRQWGASDLPNFPVDGKALKSAGVPPGRAYSKILAHLRERWKKSQFVLSLDELMKFLPEAQADSRQSALVS